MKNIKQNTLLHYGLVLMIVAAFCGLAIGVTNYFTAPIINQRLNDSELEAYEVVFSDIKSFEIVLEEATFEVIEAFNNQEDSIGYIYIVTETNQYGDFKVITGVDHEGVVLGAMFLDYQQTPTLKATTVANLELFVGLNVFSDVPSSSDVVSGATYSYDSIIQVFHRVKTYQQSMDTSIGGNI